MASWEERYLNFLSLEKAEPSYDFLQKLVESHLHHVPFEIISKFHYYSTRDQNHLIPEKEEFLENLFEKGWGGNCYILNIHFGNLLKALGFEVNIVRARGGNPHLGLMVNLNGTSYYTDVGYMAPLFEPLILENEPYLVRCGEELIVKWVGPREFLMDRRSGGQSFVAKTIEWFPAESESFRDHIIYAHRDEDENPFMRRIVATVFKERVSYAVLNSKLIIKSDKNIQITDFTSEKEWIKMMESTFHLKKQDLEFALNFLRERNVDFFSKN